MSLNLNGSLNNFSCGFHGLICGDFRGAFEGALAPSERSSALSSCHGGIFQPTPDQAHHHCQWSTVKNAKKTIENRVKTITGYYWRRLFISKSEKPKNLY